MCVYSNDGERERERDGKDREVLIPISMSMMYVFIGYSFLHAVWEYNYQQLMFKPLNAS